MWITETFLYDTHQRCGNDTETVVLNPRLIMFFYCFCASNELFHLVQAYPFTEMNKPSVIYVWNSQ